MNKKGLSEIRKTLKTENQCIDKVCACYVTEQKNKTVIPVDFYCLGEDEVKKYFDIFKKSISGTIGKTLHCIEFKNEGDGHEVLRRAIDSSSFTDEKFMDMFFDRIIENYQTEEAYCILVMHANYDVVSKSSDGEDTGSGDVYSHIICSICPAASSKPLLSYNHVENRLEEMKIFEVRMPETAFLFPSFTDRTSNIHEVLFYAKNEKAMEAGIVEGLLECEVPDSADAQADAFCESVQAAFDGSINYEQAASIHNTLHDRLDVAESETDFVLSPSQIKSILQTEDAPDVDAFDSKYKEMMGENSVYIENITKNKFMVSMTGITITSDSDVSRLISVKEVDGCKCLVIKQNGDVEVNGIPVKL